MLESLFAYRKVLARHREGPALEARERYLEHCASYGAARTTLRRMASELLVISEYIDLDASTVITPQVIALAGQRRGRCQLRRGRARSRRWPRTLFIQVATAWLRFLGRLLEPPIKRTPLAEQIEDFAVYLEDDRYLASKTIANRRWHVQKFVTSLVEERISLANITVDDIDNFLSLMGRAGWGRVSVVTSAKALRSFFRYAEVRGWCTAGISAAISAPRLFQHEELPVGPAWDDVEKLIASTRGLEPRDMRDRAILMLLAIYGLRSGEVRALRLQDLNWSAEVITIRRTKQCRTQQYPLVPAVGDAIVQYLQKVRPTSSSRQLFLTLRAPFRSLSAGCMYHVVSSRLRPLGIQAQRRGPHCLRHACAGRLVAAGLSLKEIGDHLGHTSTHATRIYAKVDLAGLREVADFDLGGLS